MPMQMTEEQKVFFLRNALVVAGQEMGAEGDHWPVIKSTVHNLMQDWEKLQVERNVFAELKVHYADILAEMEKNLELCPADLRPEANKIMKDMKDSYDACFKEPPTMYVVCDDEAPIHIKRAENIVATLGGHNDH